MTLLQIINTLANISFDETVLSNFNLLLRYEAL
jgi:hypothetical protein